MFTREELALNFHSPGSPDDMPMIEILDLQSNRSRHGASRGIFAVHCGSKDEYSSPLEFWLWSFQFFEGVLLELHRNSRYASDILCESISSVEYFDRIDQLIVGLKRPPDFLLRQNLVSAMMVFDGVVWDGIRTSWLAEFNDAFISLHKYSDD